MIKRIALAVALALAPAAALAQQPPNLYWGITAGGYKTESIAGTRHHESDLGFRLGYHFNDFLGLEGRAGTSVDASGGPDVTYGAVFGRFDLPFQKINVYLLAGASELRFDGETVNSNKEGAGGIGIELYGSERTAVTLEYMSYSNDGYNGFSLGLKHHFELPSFR